MTRIVHGAAVLLVMGLLSAAIGVDPVFASASPAISAFYPHATTVSVSGGNDSLYWTVSNASSCTLSISPNLLGWPVTGAQCSNTGTNQLGVGFPANTGTSPVSYTITLVVGGASGMTPATAQTIVTVEAQLLPPTVSALSPGGGLTTGGTTVTITGANFVVGGTTVAFGASSATRISCSSSLSCTATSPAHAMGIVDVTVTTRAGTSATSSADQFFYSTPPPPVVYAVSPNTGLTTGGTAVTITGTNFIGGAMVTFGGTPATGITVVSATEITVTSPGHAAGTFDVTVTTAGGISPMVAGDKFTFVAWPPIGYHALSPARICDTRASQPSIQCSGETLAAGATQVVDVAGIGGVPATGSGVTAVVLNVTAANGTAASYFTVYPDGQLKPGQPKPPTSSLNFAAGQNVANLVTVALPTDGKVDVYNANGTADLIVDVEGYYAPEATTGTGLYNALTPARICDTRASQPTNPCTKKTPAAGSTINVTVAGNGGVPSTGVAAVVLNVTAIDSAQAGYLTVYPTGTPQPTASNVNYAPGQVVPNRVMVPLGSGGAVTIFTGNGSPDIAVDVSGYFTDASNPSATGAQFTAAATWARICDTRASQPLNQCSRETLAAGATLGVTATGAYGVPATATAVVVNVTAADETSNGYLTVFPAGASMPVASDVNFLPGTPVANMTVATLGAKGAFSVYNSAGSTDLIVDLVGWYS